MVRARLPSIAKRLISVRVWRIELYRLGLLTVVDVHMLAAYCEAYKTWRTAVEALSAMAARDPVSAGLLVNPAGSAIQNPLFLTMRQSANDMLRYAGEFGLTPVARARLAAGRSASRPAVASSTA